MPNLIKLIRYVPAPREWKDEWRRRLIDRAFTKELSIAKAGKNREKIESILSDRRFELQMHDEETDLELTRYLVRQSRRLHVPLPPQNREDGNESGYWYEGPLTYQRLLSTEGVANLRELIRNEKKARHEARTVWIPWLSAITGAIGTATGLVALLIKSGAISSCRCISP